MSQYSIYQTDADYCFLPWKTVKDKFSIRDYNKIYSGAIDSAEYENEVGDCNEDDFKILERLFEIFNINRPNDYKGRSLSVSDVVEIKRKNITRYYYCDSFGWKEISQLC